MGRFNSGLDTAEERTNWKIGWKIITLIYVVSKLQYSVVKCQDIWTFLSNGSATRVFVYLFTCVHNAYADINMFSKGGRYSRHGNMLTISES